MNSVPSIPALVSPIDNEIVDTDQPTLWIENSTDDENDTLTYDYFIVVDTTFGEPELIEVSDYPEGEDSTGWQVPEPLHENWRYWWRVRANDQYEYSDWSGLFVGEVWINAIEEYPSAYQAIYPPDTGNLPVTEMLTEFQWSRSEEYDPLDSVYYTLQIAVDSDFNFVNTIDSIWATSYALSDSLNFDTHYWWRVKATDNTGQFTFADNVPDFHTWALGDTNGDTNVDLLDITFMINCLYKEGNCPSPLKMGDANGDCSTNLLDITYLINYLYKDGPAPVIGCE